MKTNENKATLTAHVDSESAPTVQLYNSILECSFQCDGEYQYAISTENGSILTKGEFLNGFRLDVKDLGPGFYQLVLFNALKRHVYSFRIK
jgi:hypothetical protein